MVQKFGKLTSWGWQFIPVFAGFYIHPNGGFLAGFQPSTVLLNFASRFYFGLAMFHHFAVKITPPMKQTRFEKMNLGFFSAPIIFNFHHKYGHSIIGICLWWSVWWWNAGTSLPPSDCLCQPSTCPRRSDRVQNSRLWMSNVNVIRKTIVSLYSYGLCKYTQVVSLDHSDPMFFENASITHLTFA